MKEQVLRDQVAVVTGAGGGIGRTVVQRFLHEGARVVLFDLDHAVVAAAARDLDPAGGRAVAVAGDATQAADVERAVGTAREAFGGVDILVNNAGICPMARFLDVDLATFERVMAVNVRGSFLFAQAGARAMIERKRGAIVQVSSVFAFPSGGVRDFCVYNMSKAAVRQMVHTTAVELARHGIRVNAVAPGSIDTSMLRACLPTPEAVDGAMRAIPLRRFGQPDDVAGACVFLCSDDASYITGHTLVVDGGWLLT